MNRENVIHLAESLFDEAVRAKSYFQILEQFREYSEEYNKAMNCSPAFYNVIYNALVESLFLKLYKLYDWNTASLTIRTLLKDMQLLEETDLYVDVLKAYKENNSKFRHRLSVAEECFFCDDVEETKRLCKKVGVVYTHTTKDISLQEIVQLYNKRFEKMQEEKIVVNLMERRRKIGAHNDAVINFNYKKINKEFPLADEEIEKLVEFAIDFIQFCIEILTGVHKIPEYINIRDWRATLNLVNKGMEFRKVKNEAE